MACPQVITGERFLARTLEHLDCQAQTLGSFGYQALGQPGGQGATMMTGLLALFIAFLGIRFLFGPGPHTRDIVYDVLKIGIVLTLAFSWPAFRTVVHDVVISAPSQIAGMLSGGNSAAGGASFIDRLQQADTAMIEFTRLGMGRTVGASLGDGAGSNFIGTALQDDSALGWARVIWLATTIGTFGLLRLLAGLLLALTPLIAGLLLFEATRGLFAGWLRGLALTVLASIGVSVILAVELALIEPWLADALRVRALGYATSSAPIELFAIMLGFAVIQFGSIWLLAKVAFMQGWTGIKLPEITMPYADRDMVDISRTAPQAFNQGRVQRTADSVERLVERDSFVARERMGYRTFGSGRTAAPQNTPTSGAQFSGPGERLGSSYRRGSHRASMAAKRREGGV